MPTSSRPRHPRRRPPSSGGALPAHAHLIGHDDRVIGGAALRGAEWVMVLRGTVVAAVESAAMMIAMLRHTASTLGARLSVSPVLTARASDEAAADGYELEAYLAQLETERRERREPRADDTPTRQ